MHTLWFQLNPYPAASVCLIPFCLYCLASLHQQPENEPSIISLTNTHSQCSSLESSHVHMEWKYGKNQVFLSGKFPKCWLPLSLLGFFPLSHSSSLCVILWRTDFPKRKWKSLLAEEREGEKKRERERSEGQCWGWQQPSLPAPSPTHPAASWPSQGHINPHAGHITARLHQCLLAC